MVVALLKLNFLKVKFILISIPTIYLSGKFPPPGKYPSVLLYIIYKFYEATCTSVLQFRYSVTSIFNPEQGYTKVTALKFVLVATGL